MTQPENILKRGTRIEIRGMTQDFAERWEAAEIVRPVPMTHYADKSNYPGWYVIKYADGGKLACHESGFRVTDNRP